MSRLIFLLILIMGAFAASHEAQAEKRVALVVGNSAYEKTSELPNPENDAKAMTAALTRLGFEVVAGYDLNRLEFERLIRAYTKKLKGADVGLFFYAGHGIQVHGHNFLVPVDAELESEDDLDFTMVELETLLSRMERHAKTNLIFLDACRDNPLAKNLARSMGNRSGSVGRGLAPVKFQSESLIVFATQPGHVAKDGEGEHSPFTAALLENIETPGLDVPILMRKVRAGVKKATDGSQIPWNHSSLTRPFMFKIEKLEVTNNTKITINPESPKTAPSQSRGEARMAWNEVRESEDPDLIEQFINFHKGTFYEVLARKRLKELKKLAAKPANTPKSSVQSKQAAKKKTGQPPVPNLPHNTLLGLAAEPGGMVLDALTPKDKNSPYTSALAQELADPRRDIEQILLRVKRAVSGATSGRQVPWMASTLRRELFLKATKIHAVLVGNSRYKHFPLANPGNDIERTAEVLRGFGAEIKTITDASAKEMRTALNDLMSKRRQPAGTRAIKIIKPRILLFFFAGHGMSDGERNYIAPVDVPFDTKIAADKGISLSELLKMIKRGDHTYYVFLLDTHFPLLPDAKSASADSKHRP